MAAYSSLDADAVASLSGQFGVALADVRPLAGGATNSAFSAMADGRPVVVSVLDAHDRGSADRLAGLVVHLRAAGVATPGLWPTVDGGFVATVDGTPVLLQDRVEGRHEQPLRLDRLPELGRIVAEVHGVPAPASVPHGRLRLPAGWRSDLDHPEARELAAFCERADALRPTWAGLPSGLVHGDVFDDNVIVRPDGHLVLLDWEFAAVEPFVLDLGILAVGVCRTGDRLDPDRLASVLDGYEAVRPLGADERAALPAATAYGTAYLAHRRFVRHHVGGLDPTKQDWFRELVAFGQTLDV